LDTVNYAGTGLFVLAAIGLLGSPGPAIAALISVGKARGWKPSLRFYFGLQIGLATAAGFSVLGIYALVQSNSLVVWLMSALATIYLLYLAYKVAMAPVGQSKTSLNVASSVSAGLFLGVSNPKGYIAFMSLFGSFTLAANTPILDNSLKWVCCVLVMILVDFAWLVAGIQLRHIELGSGKERLLNLTLGGLIVATSVTALLSH